MDNMVYVVVLTLAAGLCMPLGALLGKLERIGPNWLEQEFRHGMIAFGGGLLLGAVATVLLPEGNASLGSPALAVGVFMTGGLIFFALERRLGLRRREMPQLTGMLVDFVPEAMALGGLVASNPAIATQLALLIGLQNIPEGFNAYRELAALKEPRPLPIIRYMCGLALLGPLAGISAYIFIGDQPELLGILMLTAAGGIVYLMFQEIAPQSRLEKHWAPALGAVAGFGLTLLSNAWVGA